MENVTDAAGKYSMSNRAVVAAAFAAIWLYGATSRQGTYYPAPGDRWERRSPESMGMDSAALAEAVEFAKLQETDFPADFSAQRRVFGRPLGPLPKTRASTNGVVIRH